MVGVGVGSSGALPLGSPLEGALKGSWGGVTTPPEAKGGRSGGDEAGNAPGPEALDTRELTQGGWYKIRILELGFSQLRWLIGRWGIHLAYP
jgi:hypothetical protein